MRGRGLGTRLATRHAYPDSFQVFHKSTLSQHIPDWSLLTHIPPSTKMGAAYNCEILLILQAGLKDIIVCTLLLLQLDNAQKPKHQSLQQNFKLLPLHNSAPKLCLNPSKIPIHTKQVKKLSWIYHDRPKWTVMLKHKDLTTLGIQIIFHALKAQSTSCKTRHVFLYPLQVLSQVHSLAPTPEGSLLIKIPPSMKMGRAYNCRMPLNFQAGLQACQQPQQFSSIPYYQETHSIRCRSRWLLLMMSQIRVGWP